MTVSLRTSLNTGLNSGLRQSISGGAGAKTFTGSTLDLDFAGAKSLKNQIGKKDLIIFARASSATFVDSDRLIKTTPSGAARFDHDPATGESLGLLIEESRTNLLAQSQEYTSTYWSDLTNLPNGWTTTAGPAPDGSNTVTTWNSGTQIYRTSIPYSVGPQHTASVFVKDMTGGGGSIRLGPDRTNKYVGGDPRVTFRPSTQSFTTVGPGVQGYGYDEYPNGWYRVFFKYRLSLSDDIFNIVQLGAYNIGIWGAQIEEGTFVTSYIPTNGSTVTRAADNAEIPAFISLVTQSNNQLITQSGDSLIGEESGFDDLYNQTEGTVFAVAEAPKQTNIVVASISNGTNDNKIEVRSSATDLTKARGIVRTAAAVVFNVSPTANTGRFRSLALGYKATDTIFAVDGVLSSTDNSVPLPSANRLYLGNEFNQTSTRPGHIKRLSYFPTRLPDATLQSLTS